MKLKDTRVLRRAKAGFWVLLVGIYSVAAADVVIDVINGSEYRELTAVASASAHSPTEVRARGAAQIAAIHRASSATPFSSLPPGSTFKVVWPDGTAEYVQVISPGASAGVRVDDAGDDARGPSLADQVR